MHKQTAQVSPAAAAQFDWITLGEFWPEQFHDPEQRRQYQEAAARIEREFDNHPR